MAEPPSDPAERARRRGRRAGIAVFGAIMTAFTVVCASEILREVWAPHVVPTTLGCREGLVALIHAVDRAREAAADNAGDEHTALEKFRSALDPEWTFRPAIGLHCRGDAWSERALRDVDQLRYAEEHAVRYEAGGLARRRRRVQALLSSLELGTTPPAR